MTKDIMKFQNKLLGIMCLLLVPTTLLFGLLGVNYNAPGWWNSISANYYSNAKIFMIGLLFTTSVVFCTYWGYTENSEGRKDYWDRVLALISGVASLGILVFPCKTIAARPKDILLPFIGLDVSHFFHCIFAIILFVSFAVMIGWRFTKHSGKMTIKKMRRNCVYYACASIIGVFLILQIITSIAGLTWFTMINEAFILTAFSFAWLVKGEAIPFFND